MVQKLDNKITHADANTLLSPQQRINSDYDLNVTLGAADALAVLGVGYPMAFNSSTGQHAPWMAPDPTVVVITLTGATGGTFTITVNGKTTAAIAYNASAATITAELKAIGYDVSVVKATLVYTLTFDGAAEIITLPTVTADTSLATGDITESVTVNDGTAQVASPTVLNISLGVTVIATGGTFTVTYDGNTSGAIAWNASAADIQTAVLAIGTHAPDTVTVTRDSLASIAIFFDDEDDLLTLPTVSASLTNITGATGEEAQVTVGDVLSTASASDIEIDIGTATGGTFTVTVNGTTTAAIAFDATTGEVDTALANIGFTVVTGLVSTTYTITFSSKDEVITLPTLSGSTAALTGAGLTVVATAGTATNGTDAIVGFINPEDIQIGTDTGTITLSRATTTATAVTTNAHGLVTGMSVTVSGASNSTYNVTATMTVVTPTTFTYTVVDTGDNADSGSYTTTNDIMALIMVKGRIHATLPQSLVAAGDVTALNTALKDNLIAKGLIVQGLAGRY